MGKARPDLGGCRFLPVAQHVIYYRVRDDAIEVVRVLHATMDAKRRLGRR